MSADRSTNGRTYLSVDHEAEDILDTVKSEDTTLGTFPETLVVGTPTLDGRPELVDKFGVGDGDFEKSGLLITLEAVQILAHDYLDRVDGRLVLGEVSLEVSFVGLAIARSEGGGRSYVEIVHEIGNV